MQRLHDDTPTPSPLSADEHLAMTRCLTGIRRQLQDVSDLFTARYGKNSNVAELAVKALVSSALLEHEVGLLDLAQPSTSSAEDRSLSMLGAF